MYSTSHIKQQALKQIKTGKKLRHKKGNVVVGWIKTNSGNSCSNKSGVFYVLRFWAQVHKASRWTTQQDPWICKEKLQNHQHQQQQQKKKEKKKKEKRNFIKKDSKRVHE